MISWLVFSCVGNFQPFSFTVQSNSQAIWSANLCLVMRHSKLTRYGSRICLIDSWPKTIQLTICLSFAEVQKSISQACFWCKSRTLTQPRQTILRIRRLSLGLETVIRSRASVSPQCTHRHKIRSAGKHHGYPPLAFYEVCFTEHFTSVILSDSAGASVGAPGFVQKTKLAT